MASKNFFRQILGTWVALLLLTVAIAGKSVTSPASQYSATEQKHSGSDSNESKTYIGELSLQAVVITSVAFDFATPVAILPSPLVAFIESKVILPTAFSIPFHWICYFSKIFGHLIAINAP